MNVLGITTEGDSGAAIVEDGRILAAINEERLSRMKLVVGFPRAAIEAVMSIAGVAAADLDAVLVAGKNDRFVDELRPFHGWLNGSGTSLTKDIAGHAASYRDRFPVLEDAYYALQAPKFGARRRAIARTLRGEFGVTCPVKFVDHHLAHLASAYFTSGYGDALVLSLDGGGDGRSSLVYEIRDGRPKYLHEVSAFNSLGNYYAYVTILCGFKAMKHEGKITGLAAHGEPKYVPIIKRFIDEEDGTVINRGGVAFKAAVKALEDQLPSGWAMEDLAASIQAHFEDVVCRYVRHWVNASGISDVALAGGVFANVRVNEEVHSLPEISRIFMHPHMVDGGLAVGAALAASFPGILQTTMPADPEPLKDVYLGHELLEKEIAGALGRHGLVPDPVNVSLEDRIAELLAEGYLVARANGRMEYGPRALGNRSILYQPTDRSVNDWLNENLNRTEFMPFAPSVMYERRDLCFERTEGAEHPAEFMTITFHCRPWMRERMEGVVHVDGTARPHLVRRVRNQDYYRILERFEELTGLPGIINTSFNMHEEPIVCDADDCVRAFIQGRIDYLAIGPHLIRHPNPQIRELRPVAKQTVAV